MTIIRGSKLPAITALCALAFSQPASAVGSAGAFDGPVSKQPRLIFAHEASALDHDGVGMVEVADPEFQRVRRREVLGLLGSEAEFDGLGRPRRHDFQDPGASEFPSAVAASGGADDAQSAQRLAGMAFDLDPRGLARSIQSGGHAADDEDAAFKSMLRSRREYPGRSGEKLEQEGESCAKPDEDQRRGGIGEESRRRNGGLPCGPGDSVAALEALIAAILGGLAIAFTLQCREVCESDRVRSAMPAATVAVFCAMAALICMIYRA